MAAVSTKFNVMCSKKSMSTGKASSSQEVCLTSAAFPLSRFPSCEEITSANQRRESFSEASRLRQVAFSYISGAWDDEMAIRALAATLIRPS
ncbi:hypothetical protein ACFX15_023065 [Malus domestica]